MRLVTWFVAGCLAALLVGGIEFISRKFSGATFVQALYPGLHVLHSALVRIGLSALAIALILLAMRAPYPTSWLGSPDDLPRRRADLNHVLYGILGLSLGLHTFIGAYDQVNGAQTRAPPPFLNGNNHYSTKDNFRPPADDAVTVLNRRLDNDNYRSVLLCDANIAGGFCAGHIPEFWRLRVVDGYYGLGVPTRLASLPWKVGLSLRTISFTNPDQFDWPLLSLLNVKYAAKIPEAMYRNNSAKAGEEWRPADPNDVEIITNPLPVTPRYFFARHVVPVVTLAEAVAKLVQQDGRPVDVTETSFVESAQLKSEYADGKILSAKGAGDHVKITLGSSNAERFLVANELYFPGWSALVDGKSASVYPANAVMRGVVVPAGGTTVELVYTPVVRRISSFWFYGVALVLFIAGTILLGRNNWASLPSGDDKKVAAGGSGTGK